MVVEDKYIGLALAISSSVGIGTSYIITKIGLTSTARKRGAHASDVGDSLAYMKNPIWWAGITTMVLGEIANFVAYIFAPAILVTPLGALSVPVGAILASIFLKEELGHIGRIGSALCLLGSLIIVLHAPEDKPVETVDEILNFALQPGFLMYCFTALVVCLVMIFQVSPRYGKSNPVVYISICSLAGSVSVMAIKGFGVALKLTLSGNNQMTHPSTYVFGIVVVGCIMVQMNYFNKALATFSTNVVNPMYFVFFSTATICASFILFQGFNTTNPTNTISLIAGFITTFLGVHLLNISRKPEPSAADPDTHTLLEGGLMNPRVSVSGRLSQDSASWGGHVPFSAGHGRRSSLYRAQNTALHDAFDERGNGDSVGMELLREEDDEDSNERTRLAYPRGGERIGTPNGHPR